MGYAVSFSHLAQEAFCPRNSALQQRVARRKSNGGNSLPGSALLCDQTALSNGAVSQIPRPEDIRRSEPTVMAPAGTPNSLVSEVLPMVTSSGST
jgi:hypothetical protein|eukprot:COSAG06_NODE_7152_length_2607_cov_30.058214_3_plen_95_part_00